MPMLDLKHAPDRPLVAASILSADFGFMIEECRDVLDKGADLLHVDVMDGHFVPNLTMGADMIRALRRHLPETFLDVHLMVASPGDYIEPFAEAGANLFSFHVEVCAPFHAAGHDAEKLIHKIRRAGMQPGMVVNPPTDVTAMEPWVEAIDLALVMSVNPGRSGQKFIPEVLEKTRWLAQRLSARQRLEMDGGLNVESAPQAVEAGADTLVTASALFGSPNRQQTIEQLQSLELARSY